MLTCSDRFELRLGDICGRTIDDAAQRGDGICKCDREQGIEIESSTRLRASAQETRARSLVDELEGDRRPEGALYEGKQGSKARKGRRGPQTYVVHILSLLPLECT